MKHPTTFRPRRARVEKLPEERELGSPIAVARYAALEERSVPPMKVSLSEVLKAPRVERIVKMKPLPGLNDFVGAKVLKRNRVNAVVETVTRFSPTGPWHTYQHKVPLAYILETKHFPE